MPQHDRQQPQPQFGFLTARLVAEATGLTSRRVLQLVAMGRIPARRFRPGTWLFPSDTPERIRNMPDLRKAYNPPPLTTTQVDDRQPPLEPESAA